MIICDPILINKFSSETTISKFINQRLEFMVDYHCLDLNILSNNNNQSILLLHFCRSHI